MAIKNCLRCTFCFYIHHHYVGFDPLSQEHRKLASEGDFEFLKTRMLKCAMGEWNLYGSEDEKTKKIIVDNLDILMRPVNCKDFDAFDTHNPGFNTQEFLERQKRKRDLRDSLAPEKTAGEANEQVEPPAKKAKEAKKIRLATVEVVYADDESMVKIGKQKILIPTNSNEALLCSKMFKIKVGRWICWDGVYEYMFGKGLKPTEKNERKVRDAMYAVNNRIKREANTEDSLFEFKKKSLKRNF